MAIEEPSVMPAGQQEPGQPQVDRVPALVWATGPGADGHAFNAAWQDLTGRGLDELLGARWLELVHPDDRAAVSAAHRECHGDGVAFELEYRLRAMDNEFHWVLSRGGLDRAVGSCVAAALDITQRRQVEADRCELLASTAEENARLASLQSLTAGLAALTLPEEVAKVILGQGVAELGAATASLCLVADDGDTMEVAAEVGYPSEVTDRWGRFPLAAATPAGDAVREGRGIYLSNLDELHARYPIFMGTPLVGDQAVAVLPLTSEDTGALGAMVFGFTEPRRFAPAERQLMDALATQASTALARTRSRASLEAARAQLVFLADASKELAGSLDLDQTLATIADLAVPRLADRCGIYLLTDGQIQCRLWVPGDPDVNRAVSGRYPVSLSDPAGVGAVLRTGQSVFAPTVDDAMLAAIARSEEHHQLLRQIGFGAAVIVPLRARAQLLGALALVNRAGHHMTDQDRALAAELAARAAVAIDNARLYAAQVSLAHRLQASLLPPSLPAIDGLDLAARYAPAGSGAEVGGDFYDCIRLGRNRLLLIVGDVKGKGVDAAVLTGMARHVIHAVATTEHRPADVLAALNDALYRQEADRLSAAATPGEDSGWDGRWDGGWEATEPRFCTVLAVSLTRRGRGFHASVASAGHPLPMLRHPDGAVTPVGRPGPLLGILPTVDLPQVNLTLPPGSLLVCYTDGVSECHRGRCFFDESGIAAFLAGADGPADVVVTELEQAARAVTATREVRDDMAILAVRVLA